MSKGKRKSSPGAIMIVRQKLRLGTLGKEDRATLHQVSRLDLIALIEGETGERLSGSQKNSVAAMVAWLIGPDEGSEAVVRSKPHVKRLTIKKKTATTHRQHHAGRAARETTQPRTRNKPAFAVSQDEDSDDESWGPGGVRDKRNMSGDSAAAAAAAAGAAAGTPHESSCPTGGESSDNCQRAASDADPANWLRELHMQLTAAAATTATADDVDDATDDAGTAQSFLAQQQQQHMYGAGGSQQQPAGTEDELLESQLLQQLLHDMQLTSTPPQAASSQLQQPAALQPQQPGQLQPPQLLRPAPPLPLQLLERQQPQPNQQLQLQPPQLQLPQLQSSQRLQLPQLQPPRQLQLQQLPQQQPPQLLQPPAVVQLSQLQQLQQTHLSQVASLVVAAADDQRGLRPAVGVPAPGGGGGVQSCPLPQMVQDNYSGSMPAIAAGQPAVNAFSSVLPVWQLPADVTESFSNPLKRHRQQLAGQQAAGDASGPFIVETSGPSADLTIKRRPLQHQVPGSGHSATLPQHVAAANLVTRSSMSAPPRLLPYQQAADFGSDDGSQQQQRVGPKKGVKGLASKFKALLHGRSNEQQLHQQQQAAAALGIVRSDAYTASGAAAAAAAAAAVAAGVPADDGGEDLQADFAMDFDASVSRPSAALLASQCPVGSMTGRPGSSVASVASFSQGPGSTGGPSWSAGPRVNSTQLPSFGSSSGFPNTSSSGSYAFGSSYGSSGASTTARIDTFGERLKVLRAMYGASYDAPPSPSAAAAAAAAAGGLLGGPAAAAAAATAAAGGGVMCPGGGMELLPALKEEADAPTAPATAAAGPALTDGPSSPVPFMQKLTKAFRLGVRQAGERDPAAVAAAAALASSSGFSVTERSDSSFSQFLARVASTWKQDGSTTEQLPHHQQQHGGVAMAAHHFHGDSYPPLAASTSFSQASGAALGESSAAAVHMPAMHRGQSRLAVGHSAAAAAAGAPPLLPSPAEPSRKTFIGRHLHLAGRSNGSSDAGSGSGTGTGSGGSDAGGHAVEGSRGSFSRLFGPCGRADLSSAAAAVVEGSSRSFSRIFGPCSCLPDVSAQGGEEHAQGVAPAAADAATELDDQQECEPFMHQGSGIDMQMSLELPLSALPEMDEGLAKGGSSGLAPAPSSGALVPAPCITASGSPTLSFMPLDQAVDDSAA